MATPAPSASGTYCPECERFVVHQVIDGQKTWTGTELCHRCMTKLGMVECFWCEALMLAKWPNKTNTVGDGSSRPVCNSCFALSDEKLKHNTF